MTTYICEFCQQKRERKQHQGRKHVCDEPECQEKLKERIRLRRVKNKRIWSEKRKNQFKSEITDNSCEICGRDKGKNRHWCKDCHGRISDLSVFPDEAYGGLSY
jgi:hypothetical protein